MPYYTTTNTYTMNNAVVSKSWRDLFDPGESSPPKKPLSKPPDDEGKEMFTDDELNELLEP